MECSSCIVSKGMIHESRNTYGYTLQLMGISNYFKSISQQRVSAFVLPSMYHIVCR